jgi:predicted pyridoxine 5'-phosphate oxidase superfamily flavin-nucleotide-binding protein
MTSQERGSELGSAASGEQKLQRMLGTRERAERFYDRQVLDHLNEPMRRFIARQQLMFLATSDRRGTCDSTLRSGPSGFVVVLDEHRLAWPEYRGNGVMASRGNILENAHAGLLFVDFAVDAIGLHVNGRAHLAADRQVRLRAPGLPVDPVPGRRAEHWVLVDVDEAYIHCSKHIPRLYPAPHDVRRKQRQPRSKKTDYFAVNSTIRTAGDAASNDVSPRVCRPLTTSPPIPWSRSRIRRAVVSVLLRQMRQLW